MRSRNPWSHELEVAGLIATWWSAGTVILMCVKSLTNREDLEYHFGCGTTALINLVSFCVCTVACFLVRRMYPSAPPAVSFLDAKAAPIGMLAGVELCLGNFALVRLSMTFRTMLHACTPCLMLIAGVLFGVEKPSGRAALAVLLLTAGGAMSGLAEGADFQLSGVLIQAVASTIATVRWVLIQKLFQTKETEADPADPVRILDVTRITSLYIGLVGVVMTLVVEPAAFGPVGVLFGADPYAAGALARHGAVIAGYVVFIAAGVGVLMWSEMRMTAVTSALTVSVAAALHNLPVMLAGVYTFNEHLNMMHLYSLALITIGTSMYVALRTETRSREQKPLLDDAPTKQHW